MSRTTVGISGNGRRSRGEMMGFAKGLNPSYGLTAQNRSQIGKDVGFDGADAVLVTPVECPLLDAFRQHELSLDQYPHVLAQRCLGDPELFSSSKAQTPSVTKSPSSCGGK